jgi:hypothetical protein
MVLAYSSFEKASLATLTYPDKSGTMDAVVTSVIAIDEQANDQFRNVLESACPGVPWLHVSMERAPRMMKSPVYKTIEFDVQPFVLRIPLKFVKSLIKIFPSADDLRIFNLEVDEGLDEMKLDELAVKADQKNPKENFFCEEFVFKPFQAELNLRRKEKGVFSEFCNLPFNYKGIREYDLYGTRDNLKSFLKKHLKRTALKALPSMLFKRKRKLKTNGAEPGATDAHVLMV